jgi:hypothetical protein
MKYILLSILIIIAVHYLIQYLREILTIKKIKHESSEIEKYKKILREIHENKENTPPPQRESSSAAAAAATAAATIFFTENTKSDLINDLDRFFEEEQTDVLTQMNTQNNINITI